MTVLAIETSCDETGVAVVSGGSVLANGVASQIRLHQEYGGVVPELATREHLRHLLPVARQVLAEAGLGIESVDAVAATQGPGLPNALMIGFKMGQAVAFALNRPFIGIHHHEAHLYSPWIHGNPLRAEFDALEPSVSLIVSGGHTLLVHVMSLLQHRSLGSTVDDAAGECFDKVAKLLGLGYPGGPQLEKMARSGNPKAFSFPRPMLNDPGYDFSFSGLKTSVRYFVADRPELLEDRESLQDLCASVQAAIVEVLTAKTLRAAEELGISCVTASGGVIANQSLRSSLEQACRRSGRTLRLADASLTTDNAAMIGVLAEQRLLLEGGQPLTEEIRPNWALS